MIATCGLAVLSACTGMVGDGPAGGGSGTGTAPNLLVPSGYRNWPSFLLAVQRDDVAQIRDIYINRNGANIVQGEAFPDGTVMVMDLFAAQKDPSGALVHDAGGKLVKGDLSKIYLMGKELGWNVYTTPEPTGDWLYFAYSADAKTELTDPTSSCVDCHLKLAGDVDWIYGYKDYFATRTTTTGQ
jgi:hemoglobin